jgi:2',3'-cyclic-nucleotide 2'-phosphodiesterase (5'-nucleotidase family)
MKTIRLQPVAAADATKAFTLKTFSRRELLASSAAVGAVVVLRGEQAAAADGKKTFTILHTNDLHSNLIGMGPASDYTPFKVGQPGEAIKMG